jgi:hypothetical protein
MEGRAALTERMAEAVLDLGAQEVAGIIRLAR